MDTGKLAGFLKRARKRCSYEATGEIGEKELVDGTKIIGPHKEATLSYIDIYKGLERFRGKEEVRDNEVVVWSREYWGGIVDEAHKGKERAHLLYNTLKEALRKHPEDLPFRRGPERACIGEYEYTDCCTGDTTSFNGREEITFNGKLVYYLDYEGGKH